MMKNKYLKPDIYFFMIVKVPSYKIIKKCNEGLDFNALDSMEDEFTREMKKKFIEERELPIVRNWLYTHDVHNYTYEIESDGVHLYIQGHLFLPNKQLQQIPSYIKFEQVTGDVNLSNNKLTSFAGFPRKIFGNLIASYNMITDFTDCPDVIKGDIIADHQKKVKTKYPLTKENYELYKQGKLLENKVYVISADEYGELVDINEYENMCTVQLQDNSLLECKTTDVECLDSIFNLLN